MCSFSLRRPSKICRVEADAYRFDKWEIKEMSFNEKLDILAKEKLRKQREEYAKLIEAPNNNNNH